MNPDCAHNLAQGPSTIRALFQGLVVDGLDLFESVAAVAARILVGRHGRRLIGAPYHHDGPGLGWRACQAAVTARPIVVGPIDSSARRAAREVA